MQLQVTMYKYMLSLYKTIINKIDTKVTRHDFEGKIHILTLASQ